MTCQISYAMSTPIGVDLTQSKFYTSQMSLFEVQDCTHD